MKNLLFYWFRGGSTLIQGLITDRNVCPEPKGNWTPTRNGQFLLSEPPYSCISEDAQYLRKPGYVYPPYEHLLYRAHIGDQVLVPPRLVEILKPDSIVMLCRDGRNQIESMRNMKGGAGWKRSQQNRQKFFCDAANGFRRRVEFAQDLKEKYGERFSIVRMEDLLENPFSIVASIFDFWGIRPDTSAILEHISNIMPDQNSTLEHSSFKSIKGINCRWHAWSDDEKRMFNEIAGESLRYLGYE